MQNRYVHPARLSLLLGLTAATLACEGDSRSPGPRAEARPLGPRTVAPAHRPVLDTDALLSAVAPSIVIVESLDRRRNVIAQGSGVVVADQAVATTWPLVSRAFALRVRHGGESRSAEIVAVLEEAGLARLSVDLGAPIELGRDALPREGDGVFAVGSAQGLDITVSGGNTTKPDQPVAAGFENIETTASYAAGFTGGALLDPRGSLVGILASTRAGDNRNLAVPVKYVKDILALPKGTIPKVTASPLLRLPAADRQWLLSFMAAVARQEKPLSGLGVDRVNALLDRLEPLVGAELAWAKEELGLSLLAQRRLFWEDAIESRAFRRAVKSARRAETEKRLLALGLLSSRDLTENDRIIRAIAAHEPFDVPGARIDATERYLTQMLTQTDQTRRTIEAQIWEARSR